MSTISLLTLNILGLPFKVDSYTLRVQALASYCVKNTIDIVNLQEVVTYAQVYILKKAFKEYNYFVYKKAVIGPKGGLVTVSKVPLTFFDYKPFTKHTLRPSRSMVEGLIQKGMLISQLDQNVFILNTHLKAALNEDWSQKSRYYSIIESEIKDFHLVLGMFETNKIVICAGDFNTNKVSSLYKKIVGKQEIVDIFQDNQEPSYRAEFLKHNKSLCIDYILLFGNKDRVQIIKKNYCLKEKVLLKEGKMGYISDHLGLLARFQILPV